MLYGPDGIEYTNAQFDPMYILTCGYIVRNVDQNHNGTWVIEYGHKIKRRGSVNVHVIDFEDISLDNMHWTVGDSVDISVGPEDAVYCRILNSLGQIIFDNFGQCKIVLDRVTIDHDGYWMALVGLPGSVLVQQHYFNVKVHTRGGIPLVTTTVEVNGNSVVLTCSVPIEHEVNACKFRDPRDNILIAANGVGQDGYNSEAHSHDCTLRIFNASVIHMGIWRCALETSIGTHYGFLTVLNPKIMQDPVVAASVVIEPVLMARSPSHIEGDPVTMTCSISSALRYCFFRARNGTIYNVFPRMSREENFEYIGAGLDAGECGIRFIRFSASEATGWSCHVGLVNSTVGEMRKDISTDVIPKMIVRHYWSSSSVVVVEASIYNNHALDYCRFVRMDGLGFTSDNLPIGYTMERSLHMGFCILHIRNPSIVDLHPWTVAAKLRGVDGEISLTTIDNLSIILPNNSVRGWNHFLWLLIFGLCLITVLVALSLIPKTNRDWTYRRASHLRQSFRTSWNNTFTKKPLAQTQTT